ncbi:hypothetical protein ACQ5SP_15935 [Rhodovulum sp. YNF3179]|uniref:hypothetical protein n=1 Tax=Rhodovulum sp. YNF3179 TaxID=3425127 RepID=UPI003D32E5DB
MPTVKELMEQKEQLEKEIDAAMKAERNEAVKQVRDLCKTFNITATELRGCLKTRKGRKAKANS